MKAAVGLILLDVSMALANILPRQANSTTTTVSSSGGNGTGLASASACIESKYSWLESTGSTIVSTTTYASTTTLTYRNYSSIYDTLTFAANSTPTTLCDGWPRINGNTSISTSVTTFYTPTAVVSTVVEPVYTSVPPPSCTVPPAECDALNSIYSVASAAYNTSLEAYRADYTSSLEATTSFTITVLSPNYTISSPICGAPTIATGVAATQVGDPTCFENFASIQLLYWPVTRIGGDCGTNTSTMTMAPTISGKPNTFEYWGSTLTSPTVYMAFDGTWVLSSNGITVSDQSRLIIPQSATAVTSLCAKPGGGYTPKRVNYADLNWPYNADAYRCQEKCYSYPYEPSKFNTTYTSPQMTILGTVYAATTETRELYAFNTYATENLCSTIWEQDFHPVISIPPEFSSLTPAGQDFGGTLSCPFVFNSKAVFYDPPKPLTSASSVIGVAPGPSPTSSSTATSRTSAAVPGSTASPSTPSPTSTPMTTPTAVPVELPPSTSTTSAAETQPAAPGASTESPSTPGAPDTKSSSSNLLPDTSSSVPRPVSSADVKTTATALLPSPRSSAAAPVESAAPNSPAQSEADPPATTTTTPNIGGIIASVIGETSTPAGAQPSSAASAVASPADPGASSQGDGGAAPSSAASSPGGVVFTFAPTAPAAGPASSGAVADPAATAPVADPAPAFSAVGTTLVVAGTSPVVVAPSVTLTPGGAAVTVSGTTLSLASLASFLVVDGSTQAAITPVIVVAPTGPAVLTFGSNTLTAASDGAFTIAPSVTLTPGGFAVFSGAILSLATSATAVVVNGVTQNLAPAPVSAADPAVPAIVLAGSTFTADPSSAFVLPGDSTLTPGGVVTISGTTISLASSASELVVDGVTQTLPSAVVASATPVLTLGEQTFTADPSGAFSLGSGTALAPGGAVTIGGTVLSLPSSGGAVVVNGMTQTLAEVTGSSGGTAGAAQTSLPAVTSAAGTTGVSAGGVSGGADSSSTPATATTSSADRPRSELFAMAGVLLSLFMLCVV
ncbi:hypothetical protein LTR95_016267 [Oleoguttula sp. CCFEE 5521]